MLKVIVPEDRAKLDRQIAALEYQLQHDTSEKARQIHRAALNELKAARERNS
jgi:hypothetical protein